MSESGTSDAGTDPPTSPAPRRISTPRWLDLRLVLGVVLVLGSVAVGARVVSGASHTSARVAASRDLAAGTVLTAADLHVSQVQLGDGSDGVYLTGTGDAVGKKLDRPVSRNELVPRAAIRAVGDQTTLTVPLAAGTAPDLHPGQRIEVWLSTPACQSVVLLDDVAVQSVHRDDGGSFSTGTTGQDVVIDVAATLANRVIQALAIDDAKLRAGVLAGPARTSTSAPPDLTGCASSTPPR